MTYCIAIKLARHLVFASDSRTNAGPDQINTYSKMHTWGVPQQRQFVLLSAGNLATTQAVTTRIERDIAEQQPRNLFSLDYMNEVADYIGQLSVNEQERHTGAVSQGAVNAEASFLLGGQITGQAPQILLIYPQGNHISCSDTAPFLQIGEVKYGKPILDRIIRTDTRLDDAIRCALVSMDSTMRSNVTVGPPLEIAVLDNDQLKCIRRLRMDEDDPYLAALRQAWGERVVQAFAEMPRLEPGALKPCD